MATKIHPTAIIEKGAELGDNVVVGAYAYIGGKVKIGNDSTIQHHATVDGNTEMGQYNLVYPYSFIGGKTQDLKYKGGYPPLKIGNVNTFREFSTVHCATHEDKVTQIGSHNLFLAYSHIAHECIVGNHVIMSNNATLAGHVEVADHVIISGLCAVHQFCRIGTHAFIGGCSKLVKDLPPYMLADGNPLEVRMINKVGLQRFGFDEDKIKVVWRMFKALYREGLNRSAALEKISQDCDQRLTCVRLLKEFVESSERGIV